MTTPDPPAAPDGGPNRRRPDRDRLLLDLGAQVRDLGTRVDGLKRTVVDVTSTVSEFGPQLIDVQRDLGKLSEQVEELLDSPEVKNPPINWVALPAEDAEREWDALGRWVHEVLASWYEITRDQLPDCWALHRPAFLQVSWLRTSHVESYLSRSHPNQAAEWNTRWLDAALEKIKAAIPDTRCRPLVGRPGEHLVDALEAQQRRGRDPQDLRERGQQLHQQVTQPTHAPPGQPGSPYSDPTYAPAPITPDPQPTHSTTGGGDRPGEQVIQLDYWRGYFEQAMRADVDMRRQREAQQQAEETARRRDQPPDPVTR